MRAQNLGTGFLKGWDKSEPRRCVLTSLTFWAVNELEFINFWDAMMGD
jgi:hypothetical protein